MKNNSVKYVNSMQTPLLPIMQCGLLILMVVFTIVADGTEKKFTYCRPLYIKTSSWQKKAAAIFGVELQKYAIKKKLSWEKYDYSADTALTSWYQDNADDTLHSLPDKFTSAIKGDYLVVIYGLSGSERDFAKGPRIYPVVGGVAANSMADEFSGELNKYDNIFYSFTVYSATGKMVFTTRAQASDIDDAVESVVKSCTQLKLAGNVKVFDGSFTTDTSGIKARHQLGKGLFIAGSVMTFSGFGVMVGGSDDDAAAIGLTLYSIGQAGLVLCGCSNLIMRSAVLDATGMNYSISPKGYVLFGGGLALAGGGLGMVGVGLKNGIDPLVIAGIISIITGQVFSTVSWIPFVKDYRRLNNKLNKIDISPSVGISTRGDVTIGVSAVF